MKRKFFSGTTLDQALISAAHHFGIDPGQVAYKKREKKHGLLKASSRVVIEVDAENPQRLPEEVSPVEPEPRPEPETAVDDGAEEAFSTADGERYDEAGHGARSHGEAEADAEGEEEDEEEDDGASVEEDDGESYGDDDFYDEEDGDGEDEEEEDRYEDQDDEDDRYEDQDDEDDEEEPEPAKRQTRLSATASIERATREVLRLLTIDADVAIERRRDCFEIDLSADDSDALLADDGKVLQAMEYLIPRIARTWLDKGMPVKVDCEGFRAAHERELTDLALSVADEVRDEGVEQILEPMNPADRRLIHLALADDPDVETESEGRGFFKRVRIIPLDLDDSRG